MIPLTTAGATSAGSPLLGLHGLSKRYGDNAVLTGIDLTVEPGEVLALVGENGAGKSTLMRVVAGYVAASAGEGTYDGAPLATSVPEAERRGVVLVHLALHLSVAENVFLGREPKRGPFIEVARTRREAGEALAELGCDAAPATRVSDCAKSDLQMIEVAETRSAAAAHG